jgi:hypothetical protein
VDKVRTGAILDLMVGDSLYLTKDKESKSEAGEE